MRASDERHDVEAKTTGALRFVRPFIWQSTKSVHCKHLSGGQVDPSASMHMQIARCHSQTSSSICGQVTKDKMLRGKQKTRFDPSGHSLDRGQNQSRRFAIEFHHQPSGRQNERESTDDWARADGRLVTY